MADEALRLPDGAAGAAARPGAETMQPRTLTAVPSSREVPQTAAMQARAEGVDVQDDRIEFKGRFFRMADEIGMMPLLAFSFSAQQGVDSDDMAGLAAMYALIRDTIDQSRPVQEGPDGEPLLEPDGSPKWAGPSEWMLFERHAMDTKASGEDLFDLVQRVMKAISSRPPKRPGDSSTTSPPSSESMKDDSPSPAPGGRTWHGAEGLMSVKDIEPLAR